MTTHLTAEHLGVQIHQARMLRPEMRLERIKLTAEDVMSLRRSHDATASTREAAGETFLGVPIEPGAPRSLLHFTDPHGVRVTVHLTLGA